MYERYRAARVEVYPLREEQMTTVYKVVRRRRDGQLASAIMKRGKLVVIYEPSKETHSLNGMKLLALDSRLHARWFYEGNYAGQEFQIWECEATNPKDRYFLSGDWSWRGMKRWWASYKGPRDDSMMAPIGTVACDSITLIKRVDETFD